MVVFGDLAAGGAEAVVFDAGAGDVEGTFFVTSFFVPVTEAMV